MKAKIGDISVAVMFVAIVLIIILPVPSGVLDILLALNISLAVVILLNVVYSKEPLQLSVFPSLLLFTTLYRLALNIKSTTLILAQGEAGEVIRGFGNFVAQGNLVVGAIIFLIITIVQFLVITKGTERVSEVAARFTLDAMPGKQMAIDADLNAGLITEAEAKERRKKIQRESDFYGAMDGATKFVKGDAIAGLIITIINVVGGIIIGVIMRNEEIGEALQNYAILTIGDGLVSQVPALLISVATGLIVTKSTSDEGISNDLRRQIVYNPKVFFIAAGFCILLSIPLATLPFLALAALFIIVGLQLKKQSVEVEKQEEIQIEKNEVEEIRKPENVVNLLQVDPIELEFGYGIIPLADVNQGGDLLDRVVMIRRQLALELGMIVPIIRLRDNIQLNPNEYVIKIKGVEVAGGELMLDHYLAMSPGFVEEEIEGIKTTEPAFGLPAVWITEAQRDKAEMLGYTVVDPPSIIATHLTEVIKAHAHELTGRQEVQTIIDKVKENYPAIVEELVPKVMTIGEIQKVIANLLKEGVSVRDIVTILETLADYAPITHDTDMLTEYVRQALGRAISKKFIRDKKSTVITLDPKLEQMIMDSVQKTEHGSYINLEPSVINKILNNLSKQVQKLVQLGQQPIVLASPFVRLYFRRLSEQSIPGLVVLSYNELDPSIEIQSIGTVSI
ncbi:MAG TPA: flagellar biosynthesis protein FlhA [Hungateiclostridium thermocellum]|uniref:Flagellar biosynthesis protein FlhA n=2 Tax=Acetivibrio thermocellus TaxID=1515 RepID=A3DCP4_ACET2|nr:flagellar biosynthesis protein FlhA [Acetivibrio thermocellus]CDG35199.1 Flagellar biosynthesis protein FlhA [Acetivibrio thermocellus BC1]ABN51723.1 flagellar biosynthesis protein FlhA [Acetivibrio thermocellus ATCC 27405]ADU74792.1 flagellar biosynthesis protein FlhA [Acetivibrio thermocellus DSM 1313]ALX08744.1 flagellar biosynthesis protein FlhA [Acetivibrio thermocellus AD2]ANV76496.1 flagellar biosynthesis protein FlhA [Acetivibrio thermocellus DSM 2360]